jgi:hypothetical protein
MAIVLSNYFITLHPSIKNFVYKGKGYELLSLYSWTEDPNRMSVLIDEDNVIEN